MAIFDIMDRSLAWLDKFQVDEEARRVFLLLNSEQQEEIRRQGGLGSPDNTSPRLMARIRAKHGFLVKVEAENQDAAEDAAEPPPPPPPAGVKRPKVELKAESQERKLQAQHSTSSHSLACPAVDQQSHIGSSSSHALDRPATFKGSGKGSLGDPLEEEPTLCASRDYPEPKKYSEKEIENYLNGGYFKKPSQPFWAGGDHSTIKLGAHVLWRSGEKLGRNGGPSTKIEYFHGMVDGRDGDRFVLH